MCPSGAWVSIVAYMIMTAFSESLPAMIIGLVMNSIGLVPLQAALTASVADVGELVCWNTGVSVRVSVFSLTGAGAGNHLCDGCLVPLAGRVYRRGFGPAGQGHLRHEIDARLLPVRHGRTHTGPHGRAQ